MSTSICPQCCSTMVLRIAKRGPKSGEQFYGCSKYPKCKQILRIDEVDNPTPDTQNGQSNSSSLKHTLPRRLFARSIKKGCEVQFFESAAVSSDIIEELLYSDNLEQILKSFLQWRVDYPTATITQNLTERHRQVISVAQKILTRGHITLCSPDLEKYLKAYFIKEKSDSSK